MGLIVDNFAGGGGASVALERALGRKVDIAVNHDAEAIAMHTANHPDTRHYQEDVFHIRPAEVCTGAPIDVAWFSPDCTHFSKARGKAPVSKRVRGLAWVVMKWAALPKWQRPRVIFLENVEEFLTWGPIDKSGYPIKDRQGETFRLWKSNLESLGYVIDWKILKASDYGAPTIRKRLFLVARCDGEPIRWPEPTHGDPRKPGFAKSGLKPWRTAADIIDWSIPCHSIFERTRPLKPKTLARIARGIKRYVLDDPQPFIVPVTHSRAGDMAFPSDEPLRTITTAKGGEMALVTPTLVHAGPHILNLTHGGRVEDIDEPMKTITGANRGEKALIVASFLAQHNAGPNNNGLTGRSAEAPLSTVTVRGTQQAVVTSHLLKLRGTARDGQRVTEPVPTITAGGLHVGEVRAFLVKYFSTAVGQTVDEPFHTITAKPRFGLVTVHGETYQIADIGMRMLSEAELFRAQGFPDGYIIRPEINGKPMTKSASIARCGNSVCPDVADAIIQANAPMFSRLERSAA